MKRTLIVAAVTIAVAVAVAPWFFGWRTEQLVRARVAQVEADKDARIRLRIDSYERGWRGASARISVVDRDGAPLVTLPAAIRHWPFAAGGPADWVAVPELGQKVRDALGPWGAKLPELTTRTRLSWAGDAATRIESPEFRRRVPEVAGGTLDIAAIAGTVDWRRDGALTYDLALPVLRVERQPIGRADAPDVMEFRDAVLKGDGFLGAPERRWSQKGSLGAASVSLTEAGTTILTATNPVSTFATRDEGQHVGVQFTLAASAVGAKHTLQNLSDAAIEFTFDARHLAKEPLSRFMDEAAKATDGDASGPRAGAAGTCAGGPGAVGGAVRGPAAGLTGGRHPVRGEGARRAGRDPARARVRRPGLRSEEQQCRARWTGSTPKSTPAPPRRWSSAERAPAPRRRRDSCRRRVARALPTRCPTFRRPIPTRRRGGSWSRPRRRAGSGSRATRWPRR